MAQFKAGDLPAARQALEVSLQLDESHAEAATARQTLKKIRQEG